MIQTENISTKYKHSEYKAKEQIIDIRNFRNLNDKQSNFSEKMIGQWTTKPWQFTDQKERHPALKHSRECTVFKYAHFKESKILQGKRSDELKLLEIKMKFHEKITQVATHADQ